MGMTKIRNIGVFQRITQKYYQVTRQSFDVNKDYFDKLKTRHFTKEFTSKYNENLFVDQDKNAGQNLINEILLSDNYFSYLSNELRILESWVEDFNEQYQNLKSLLAIEEIEINKNSKQYKQLELLEVKSLDFLKNIEENRAIINGGLVLPLQFKTLDNTNLEIAEDFVFERLHEYKPELRFIEVEPSENFAIVIVFRRLSEIVIQLKSVNRLLKNQKHAQTKFIHGNAGMGKSNISVFLYKELLKHDKPVILLNAKSFNGNPDSFDQLFMNNLLVPDNYQIEEVLERLNIYAQNNICRVTIIIDGLNETSCTHSGFSKIWGNSLDNFIEVLERYPYLYLVATLRTSYISRIWQGNSIPYSQIQLKGFKKEKLNDLIKKYFTEYNIKLDKVTGTDVFYFSTPLYLDLYCKMLNGNKSKEVEPLLGLDGFKQVFDNYKDSLVEKTWFKLSLISKDQVLEGIDRVSEEMIEELEAFVPKKTFFDKMQGKEVDVIDKTIGFEILEEYLIYLDENLNGKDVIIHTQQEVGGYLLANKLISDKGSVDEVVESRFFHDYILGKSGKFHQLKDDILKFLISEAGTDSLLYTDYIDNDVVKKFTTLFLFRTKASDETIALASKLQDSTFSLEEVRTLIDDVSSSFYEKEAGINFFFLKEVFLKLGNLDLDFSWTLYIYNYYGEFKDLLNYYVTNQEQLDGSEDDNLYVEVVIWLSETTIRDLRDKSTRFLLRYYERFPELLLNKILEYANTERFYINERLSLVCYGVCLRLQNEKDFIQNHLGAIAESLYNLQFSQEPTNPTYNYIAIDSYKHIIDLAVIKGVFNLSDENLIRLNNYSFVKDDWFEITPTDIDNVPIAYNWDSSGNPDPLRGDFVHYTIPRLDNRNHDNRVSHTANIYKELIRLGYISDMQNLSEREQSFYYGNRLLGSKVKIDRLGKKYSWMAYFNYAGYLLNQNKLGVWLEEDTPYSKLYNRLSDTEIDPSYEEYIPISEKLIEVDFFKNRSLTEGSWISKPNYALLDIIYIKDDYTLLSAFVDQKLDENYKTRSWVEAKSFFVDKDKVTPYIEEIENKEYDWKDSLNDGGMLSKTYFGELYWADNIPDLKKEWGSLPLESTIEVTRKITHFEVRESGEFNYEDIGKEKTETVNKKCSFEYEPTLLDFLWESSSDNSASLRCDIPSPNIGKHLQLTVNSRDAQILNSNLEVCFKKYFYEYGHNSDSFHFFKTDLLKNYLEDTNQLLMYQLKQHTYDQATEAHHEHFRGMRFVFSKLNR